MFNSYSGSSDNTNTKRLNGGGGKTAQQRLREIAVEQKRQQQAIAKYNPNQKGQSQ